MSVLLTEEGERRLAQEMWRLGGASLAIERDCESLMEWYGITATELAGLLRDHADWLDPRVDSPTYALADPSTCDAARAARAVGG